MNRPFLPGRLAGFLFIFLLLACGDDAPAATEDGTTENTPVTQAETRRERVDGTRVTFELPSEFDRSRAYLLPEAIDDFRPGFYSIYDDLLEQLEREDPEADIFIDTTGTFDHFTIRNFSKLELTEDLATLYAANLEQRIQERAADNRGLTSERLTTTLNEGNGKTMLKLKYKHDYARSDNRDFYETIYFITDAVQTFFITEYHRGEADLERTFWRMTY